MRSSRTVSLLLCTIAAAGLACNPSNPAETGPGTTGPGTTGPGTGTASTTTPTTGEVSTTLIVSSTGAEASSTGTEDTCGFICDTTGESGVVACFSIDGLDDGLTTRCPCDLFGNDCPEDYKCSAYADGGGSVWNDMKCVPVNGDRRPGESCTVLGDGMDGLDDCIEGARCWSVNAENAGTCVALCSGTPDMPVCPDPATECAIFNQAVLNLCLPTCDPRVNDCAEAEVCQPYDQRFVCGPDNSGAGGQLNDACDGPGACDPGLACAPSSASPACDLRLSGCCQPYCAYPDGVCADPGQTCAQWFDPIDLPADDPGLGVGVCSVAP